MHLPDLRSKGDTIRRQPFVLDQLPHVGAFVDGGDLFDSPRDVRAVVDALFLSCQLQGIVGACGPKLADLSQPFPRLERRALFCSPSSGVCFFVSAARLNHVSGVRS